jgi:hypothetical protein
VSKIKIKTCPFCGKPPHVALNDRTVIACANGECFGPRTTAAFFDDAAAQWNTRAVPAQEPVAWRYRWHAPDDALWESVTDKTMLPTDPIGWDIEPLYPAPVPPSDIAEDCAKIAEDHVGACSCTSDDTPGRYARSGYDEACRDIAKAIRDTHGVDVDAATGTADDQDFR